MFTYTLINPPVPLSGQALVSAGLRVSREGGTRGKDQHPPTLLNYLLHDDHLQEPDILCLLTDLFLAAADTVSITFLLIFLTCCLYHSRYNVES